MGKKKSAVSSRASWDTLTVIERLERGVRSLVPTEGQTEPQAWVTECVPVMRRRISKALEREAITREQATQLRVQIQMILWKAKRL